MNNFPYDRSGGTMMGFAVKTPPTMQSGYTKALPENPVVAMAYVPFQTDITTYDETKALRTGTLFPVLDKPFIGRGAR